MRDLAGGLRVHNYDEEGFPMRIRMSGMSGLGVWAVLAVLLLVVAACVTEDTTGDGDADVADDADEDAAEIEDEDAGDDASDEDDATDDGDDEAAVDEAELAEAIEETASELCVDEFASVEAPEGFTVGLVTDIGTVADGTFNQSAYEGMQAAADCFGFETEVIETASEADYSANMDAMVAIEPDVVLTVGFLLADATMEYSEANPDINFVGIDQFQQEYPDNYVGVQFREDQGGYLAGTMAALMTESNVIGVIAGQEEVPPVVRFSNAIQSAVADINPDATVQVVYHESFTDPAAGQSTANQMLGEGADVIFGAGGLTGSGGIQAAAEDGAWVIGVDQDEYYTTFGGGSRPGADRLLTSAIKRIDIAVFDQIAATISGEFAGDTYTLTAENDGITYTEFHDAEVPDDVAEQLEEVRQGLADGSIETGVDPATGEPL